MSNKFLYAHIFENFDYRELVSDLKGELAMLRRQVLEEPTKSRRDHSSHDSESQNRPTTIDLGVIPTPATLKQDDYPDVPYWKKQEWDAYVERRKLANKNPPWNAMMECLPH